MNDTMTAAEHRERHRELHRALDELIADFIDKTGKLPSSTTLMELMEWSYQQTLKPDTESAPFRWEADTGAGRLGAGVALQTVTTPRDTLEIVKR